MSFGGIPISSSSSPNNSNNNNNMMMMMMPNNNDTSPRQSGGVGISSTRSSGAWNYLQLGGSMHNSPHGSGLSTIEQLGLLPFVSFYQREPKVGEAAFSMDEIFRLASRRMSLLHTLQEKQDQLAYTASSGHDLSGGSDLVGSGSTSADAHTDRTSHLVSGLLGYNSLTGMLDSAKPRLNPDVAYEHTIKQNMEDFVSHWACRLAFCQDPRWAEWFVKNERILFREKLRLIFTGMSGRSAQALSASSAATTSGVISFGGVVVPSSSNSSPQSNNLMTSPDHNDAGGIASISNSQFASFLSLFPSSKAELVTKKFLDDEATAGWLFDFLALASPSLNLSERSLQRIEFINRSVHSDLFTVPFTAVKDLVKKRKVFVHKGRAVIQAGDLIDYITSQFSDVIRTLTRKSIQTRRSILEDVPLADASTSPKATLLAMLDSVFKNCIVDPVLDLQAAVETQEGAIALSDVQKPALAQQHMPPCMLNMDQALRTQGHLKHNGRFQYSLFLKAAGLKMLDALRFFAETMTQKGGGVDAFTKSAYGYGIRHVYGKEGKHTDYSALNCPSMINGPTPNTAADRADCYGCPFKTMSDGDLRRSLGFKRIGRTAPTPADIEEIVADKRGSHFTRACRRYFTAIHGGVVTNDGQLFRSPVEFFAESRKIDFKDKEAQQQQQTALAEGDQQSAGDRRDRTTSDDNSGSGAKQVSVATRTLFSDSKTHIKEEK